MKHKTPSKEFFDAKHKRLCYDKLMGNLQNKNIQTPTAESSNDNGEKFYETISLLSEIANFEVYERLNASNDKAAKEEFVNNPDLVHPRNEYGFLDISKVYADLETIDHVSMDAHFGDYREDRICELVADYGRNELNFLKANYRYNMATTPEEKAEAAAYHRETNEALYGKPDEDTFYAILGEEIDAIDTEHLSPADHALYEQMISNIGYIKKINGGAYHPKPETVEKFHHYANLFFEPFLKHVPKEKSEFSPEELCDLFNEIIKDEFGEGTIPYRAITTNETANLSVNHDDREIRIPKHVKAPYTNKRCRELIVHELGTHVMRALPYVGQKIKIFSSGLPGNESIEEGIAKCAEQGINGKAVESGRNHYINIGLATFKHKNFREIYDIQMAIRKLTGKGTNTVINDVQRCFRGTGELPNFKDLAYYNGSTEVWKYIESHIDDLELFDTLYLSGKSNIKDDEQSRLAYEMRTVGTIGAKK